MINVNDLKTGLTIIVDNHLYQVLEFLHVKPGKGSAFVRTKLKDLRTKAIIEHTFNSSIKVEKAIVNKQKVEYIYNTGHDYVFMKLDTYEQLNISKDLIKEEIKYLKENLKVELLFFNQELLGINLPDNVEYQVIETEPAVRGNTATTALKEAKIETGLIVKVPLFIEEGETIIVSTKDSKYVSRK
ncbi:MAG: elongation factor P [Bacilli bacterium]|jgi:elongation factor P